MILVSVPYSGDLVVFTGQKICPVGIGYFVVVGGDGGDSGGDCGGGVTADRSFRGREAISRLAVDQYDGHRRCCWVEPHQGGSVGGGMVRWSRCRLDTPTGVFAGL